MFLKPLSTESGNVSLARARHVPQSGTAISLFLSAPKKAKAAHQKRATLESEIF
jgi:hypothetical protein